MLNISIDENFHLETWELDPSLAIIPQMSFNAFCYNKQKHHHNYSFSPVLITFSNLLYISRIYSSSGFLAGWLSLVFLETAGSDNGAEPKQVACQTTKSRLQMISFRHSFIAYELLYRDLVWLIELITVLMES